MRWSRSTRSRYAERSARLSDLPGPNTARAHQQASAQRSNTGVDPLQVRLPGPLGLVVRVADAIAHRPVLATDFAGTRHRGRVLTALLQCGNAGQRVPPLPWPAHPGRARTAFRLHLELALTTYVAAVLRAARLLARWRSMASTTVEHQGQWHLRGPLRPLVITTDP